MNILLDTHTLLWWLAGEGLDPTAEAAIADPTNLVLASAVSVWELAIKSAIGKLTVEGDLAAASADSGFEPLPVTHDHARAVGSLPLHHRDPFDRMLIAQAQLEGCTVATRDGRFAPYDVPILHV